MKIRSGFVSNSSSSSFILYAKGLREEVLDDIFEYAEKSENWFDKWESYRDKSGDYICFRTDMDNVDLDTYVMDELGLDNRVIYHNEHLPGDIEDYIEKNPYKE